MHEPSKDTKDHEIKQPQVTMVKYVVILFIAIICVHVLWC